MLNEARDLSRSARMTNCGSPDEARPPDEASQLPQQQADYPPRVGNNVTCSRSRPDVGRVVSRDACRSTLSINSVSQSLNTGCARAGGAVDTWVSQSVSQLFHGPAPRSPLHRLSIRLRRSLLRLWMYVRSFVACVGGPGSRHPGAVAPCCGGRGTRNARAELTHSRAVYRDVSGRFSPIVLGFLCVPAPPGDRQPAR